MSESFLMSGAIGPKRSKKATKTNIETWRGQAGVRKTTKSRKNGLSGVIEGKNGRRVNEIRPQKVLYYLKQQIGFKRIFTEDSQKSKWHKGIPSLVVFKKTCRSINNHNIFKINRIQNFHHIQTTTVCLISAACFYLSLKL